MNGEVLRILWWDRQGASAALAELEGANLPVVLIEWFFLFERKRLSAGLVAPALRPIMALLPVAG
jgi:hypothetical protein